MSNTSSRWSRRAAIWLVALFAALAVPVSATAAVETFHRFEVDATANYTVTEQCPDGRTSKTLVQVIGGHEEESEDGVITLDSDFVTVRLLNFFDCDGNFINDRGFGAAEFTFSPSLQTATVAGTITTRDGRSVSVERELGRHGPDRGDEQHHDAPRLHGPFPGPAA